MHRLMAVPIQAGSRPAFATGAPKTVFVFRVRTFLPESNSFPYSVAANGLRFLLNVPVNTVEPTLEVVVNWEKAVPAKER